MKEIEIVVATIEARVRPVLPAGVGLYAYPAPKDASEAIKVIYRFMGAGDEMFVGNVRRHSVITMEIGVEALGGLRVVSDIAASVDEALRFARDVVTEFGRCHRAVRMAPISYPFSIDGREMQHLGGTYRFTVSP